MKANLDKNLAPAWVSGKSYSTGEFCLYNKRLYICTTDNSDAEFDNSKWERRNLVDLVSGINSNLGGKFLGFYSITSGSKKHVFDSTYNKILLIVHAGQSAELTPSISVTFNGISNSLIRQTTWTCSRHYIEKIYELTNVKESDILNIQCDWEGCYYLIQM